MKQAIALFAAHASHLGADGADGLLHLREAGASTLAQDEETCVVFGMPKEAIAIGAVDEVLPIQHVARAILNFDRRG